MFNKTFYILSFLFLSNIIYGQKVTIKGKIMDIYGNSLMGASITASPIIDSTKINSYAISDKNGEFMLETIKSGHFLKVSYMGFEKKYIDLEKKTTNQFDIVLQESLNALNEVVIETSFIRDTIQLKLDSLRYTRESSLEEILKNNQGMTVTEEGGISYMGVPIMKILINEKEVFVNQNTTALANITYEMIEDIQVVNNYKNKFNVDFDNFEETVLNINTKDKFKGVLKNILELGVGYEDVFSLKGKSFLFSDKLNIFLTQNTNNILDRPTNVGEIKQRYENKNSLFYETNIADVVKGLNYVSDDFSNHTYLILKKELQNLKLGANLGFNYSEQESKKEILISNAQGSLSKEILLEERQGNIFFMDFNAIQLLSPTFSISYFLNFDVLSNQPIWTNEKTIYEENKISNNSNIKTQANNFLMSHSLRIKKIFEDDFLLDVSADYFMENYDGETTFFSNDNSFQQNLALKKDNFNLTASLFYQIDNLLNFGIKSSTTFFEENLFSKIDNSQHLQRSLCMAENGIIARGKNQKLNYFFNIGFQKYYVNSLYQSKSTKPFVSSSLNYKLTNEKSIGFSYENSYSIEKTRNAIDTLFFPPLDFVVSDSSFLHNIKRRQSLNLYYSVNDVPNSSNFSVNIAGTVNHDFSQTTFTGFNSNFNFFERIFYDEKSSVFGKISYSKGIYFSEKDHRLQLGGSVSGAISNSQTLQENALVDLDNNLFQYNFGIGFIPQKMFIDEIDADFSQSFHHFFLDETETSSLQTSRFSLSLTKEENHSNFLLNGYFLSFQTPEKSSYRTDLGFAYRYYFNEKFSLFFKTLSFLSLLGFNNDVGNVTIVSDNGINIKTTYKNIYGYAILGVQIKI